MKKLFLILVSVFTLMTVNATVVADKVKADTAQVVQETTSKDVEELKAVLKAVNESGVLKTVDETGVLDNIGPHVIGFAAVISPFLTGFLIVLIVLIFNHRNKKAKYRLMEKAIEAGREIPQSFFEEAKSRKTPLQSAFTLIGVGIGLFLMLWFVADHNVAFVGAIPFLIGVGKLVAYNMERKTVKSEEDDQQVG